MSITLKEDLAQIASTLNETFQIVPFKRDYDTAFGRYVVFFESMRSMTIQGTYVLDLYFACKNSLIQFQKIIGG